MQSHATLAARRVENTERSRSRSFVSVSLARSGYDDELKNPTIHAEQANLPDPWIQGRISNGPVEPRIEIFATNKWILSFDDLHLVFRVDDCQDE